MLQNFLMYGFIYIMSDADKEPQYLAAVIPPNAEGVTDGTKRRHVRTIHKGELHADEHPGLYDEKDIANAKAQLSKEELANVYANHARDGHRYGAVPDRPLIPGGQAEPRKFMKSKSKRRAG